MDYHAILEVKSLRKTYDSRLNVLNNIDFSIQKGEVVVIIGPSGCGKSTFLRCLNRLEDIQDGTLFLEGVAYEREKKNIYKIREKVGMVLQSYDLFPHMTIMENLLIGPRKVQKRDKKEVIGEAEELLERV